MVQPLDKNATYAFFKIPRKVAPLLRGSAAVAGIFPNGSYVSANTRETISMTS